MDNQRYLLIEQYLCPECAGSGWITNLIWQRYWEEHPDGGLTDEEDDAWFREQGYTQRASEIPEELLCSECDGIGSIRREVELRKVLQTLELLPRPLADLIEE